MPIERPFRYKYASRSPERILCLNSVRLVSVVAHSALVVGGNQDSNPSYFPDDDDDDDDDKRNQPQCKVVALRHFTV